MIFYYPEVLFAIPVAAIVLVALRSRKAISIFRRPRNILRALIISLMIIALSGPAMVTTREGVDLILVIDLSSSMPKAGHQLIDESIRLAESERGDDDRIGIVTFGARSRVERVPSQRANFTKFEREIQPHASDLSSAIQMALDLIDDEAAGKLLIISDGEYTGSDPRSAAWLAASRGVQCDFRHVPRPGVADVAVLELQLPLQVGPRESFSFAGVVTATEATEVAFTLKRNGLVITDGRVKLNVGRNKLLFRDRPAVTGIAEYSLSLGSDMDRIPENNVGRGVTRVEARGAILLVTHDGKAGNIGTALATTNRTIDVVHVKDARFDLDTLAAYRLVVFENVAASEISWSEQLGLVRFVRDTGGGFLLTGGRRSFGIGGYHRSRLEELLPVSLELRSEQRKLSIAMAFVLDRSGSMGAATKGGQTKMQLANSGCIAALDMLSRYDQVSVIAVDSSPHTMVPLTDLEEPGPIKARISAIRSEGGGIYTYTGLLAGGKQISKATASGRRIVLFADAADAEEPGKYVELLKEYSSVGVTVSVIALGTEADRDAEFLKDVATRGGGEIYFTDSAEQLPQLFAMEAIGLTKAGFVDTETSCAILPDLVQMGFQDLQSFPDIGGYNLTNLKPDATLGIRTSDENAAPVLAYRHVGLGRTASLCVEADGEWTGDFATWDGYAGFFSTLADQLINPGAGSSFNASAVREGLNVTVTLELDPEDPDALPSSLPTLQAMPSSPTGKSITGTLTWEDEHTLACTYLLSSADTWHHVLRVGDDHLQVNPVTLPYSPEFEPRLLLMPGRDVLMEVASVTSGQERIGMGGVFLGPEIGRRLTSRVWAFIIAALILALVEIAQRRLSLFSGESAWQWKRATGRRRDDSPQLASAETIPAVASEAGESGETSVASDAARLNRDSETEAADDLARAKERARRRLRD